MWRWVNGVAMRGVMALSGESTRTYSMPRDADGLYREGLNLLSAFGQTLLNVFLLVL